MSTSGSRCGYASSTRARKCSARRIRIHPLLAGASSRSARELADGLQHPEPVAGAAERGSCRRGTGGCRGRPRPPASAASRVQPPRKTDKPGEETLLVRRQQVMAPLDRGSQRLLARIGIPPALEQVETLRTGARGSGPASGPLARRRPARSRAAGCRGPRHRLADGVIRLSLGRAGAEQVHRFGVGQRQDRVLDLAPDPEALAAGDDQREVGAGLDERRRAPARQRSPARGCRGAGASRAPRCARPGRPWRRASGRSSPSTTAGSRIGVRPIQNTPGLELGDQVAGGLDRQARLARAAGTGQGQQPRAIAEQRGATSATSASRPMNELAGRAGWCSRSSSAAGTARRRAGRSRPAGRSP